MRVQIPDKVACLSPSTNALGKEINPTILPPVTSKKGGKAYSISFVCHLV